MLNLQLKEMRGARNARIVIADCHFAGAGSVSLILGDDLGHEIAQIGFDTSLVLRGRRYDARRPNHAALVGLVGMIKGAARCFGDGAPDAGARLEASGGRDWTLVAFDYLQRFIDRV